MECGERCSIDFLRQLGEQRGEKLIYTRLQPTDSFLQLREQATGSGAGVIETASPLRTDRTLPIRLIGFVCKSVHYKLIAVNAREMSGLRELDLTGEGLASRMCDDFLIYHWLGSEGVRRALLVFVCARGILSFTATEHPRSEPVYQGFG